MENHRLASQFSMVILGEGDVDILLFTHIHADNLLLKAGNELTGTQLQVKVSALAAVEGNAIVKALKVNVGGVAHFSSTLNILSGSNVLSHPIQLSLNLSIGNGNLSLLHFQALILAQSDLRVDLGGQGQGNHTVVTDLHIGQVGTTNGLELLLGNGKVINFGEDLLQAIFIEDVGAIHSLDHLPGSFALTEAGDLDILASLHVSLVDTGLHQFLVDLNNDGSLVALLFNALYVHLL